MIRRAIEKSVLLGPAPIRRAAAARASRPEEAWMLLQPRAVRRSYSASVLGGHGDVELLSEMWMLRQPREVRESYIAEVLQVGVEPGDGR